MSSLSPSEPLEATGTDAQPGSGSTDFDCYKKWVNQVAHVCERASKGDLEPRLLHIDVDGELGDMLHAINHLLDMTDAFVREAGASLKYASEDKYFRVLLEHGLLGSFRRTAGVINNASAAMSQKNDDLLEVKAQQMRLADAFEAKVSSMVETVAAASTELQVTAESLIENAGRTNEKAAEVSCAAREACSSMEGVAISIDQLSEAVREINEQVSSSSQITREAICQSEAASERVETLSETSDRIGSVIHIIRQVAEQTNLLALNATIEAARAGEVGKGFAVVASEVKSLSGKTGSATEEIEGQVADIRSATGSVVESMGGVGSTLVKMDEIAATIAAAVEEQDAVTKEVNRNTQDASCGVQKVTESIDTVSKDAEQTSEVASQLLEAATELSRLSENLRTEVSGFVSEIRTQG